METSPAEYQRQIHSDNEDDSESSSIVRVKYGVVTTPDTDLPCPALVVGGSSGRVDAAFLDVAPSPPPSMTSPLRVFVGHESREHANAITGPVSASLGFLSDLCGVYLFNNHFSESIPTSGDGFVTPHAFNASNNHLTRYCTTSGQLVLPTTIPHHGSAVASHVLHPERKLAMPMVLKDARLVFEEMPSKYPTTAHSVSSLLLFGAINICEDCKIFGGCTDGMVVLCTLLVKRVVLQPWPPPEQFVMQGNGVQLRPIPWPSFMGHTVDIHLQRLVSLVLSSVDEFNGNEAIVLFQLPLGAIMFISEVSHLQWQQLMVDLFLWSSWYFPCVCCKYHKCRDYVLWTQWNSPCLQPIQVSFLDRSTLLFHLGTIFHHEFFQGLIPAVVSEDVKGTKIVVVQAQTASAMWLLLAINYLAHGEFQFSFEIAKMMGIFAMACAIPRASLSGCALLQERVQRKCGGNCGSSQLDFLVVSTRTWSGYPMNIQLEAHGPPLDWTWRSACQAYNWCILVKFRMHFMPTVVAVQWPHISSAQQQQNSELWASKLELFHMHPFLQYPASSTDNHKVPGSCPHDISCGVQLNHSLQWDYSLTSLLVMGTILAPTCLSKVHNTGYINCCIELQPWPPPIILHATGLFYPVNILVLADNSGLVQQTGKAKEHECFRIDIVIHSIMLLDGGRIEMKIQMHVSLKVSTPIFLGPLLAAKTVTANICWDLVNAYCQCIVFFQVLAISSCNISVAFVQHGGCFSACRVQRRIIMLFGILMGSRLKLRVVEHNCFLIPVTGDCYHPRQKFWVARSCNKCNVFRPRDPRHFFCQCCIRMAVQHVYFSPAHTDWGHVITPTYMLQWPKIAIHRGYNLSIQVIVQFPWDPGGSEVLYRLGGKPKLKKGGMLGINHCWASYGPWALCQSGYAWMGDYKWQRLRAEQGIKKRIQNQATGLLTDFSSFLCTTDPDDFGLRFNESEANSCAEAGALILNTLDGLEADVLAALRAEYPRVYTVGPLGLLFLQQNENDQRTGGAGGTESTGLSLWKQDAECLAWLDTQERGSVVYVNFGSHTVVTPEQLDEFAWGLAGSGHRFLWSMRDNLVRGGGGGLDAMPPAFKAETAGQCHVAAWCPQEQVLRHPAVGCFLTHSGWNSTCESVAAGVPMVCWPGFSDQYTNCKYACEVCGVSASGWRPRWRGSRSPCTSGR